METNNSSQISLDKKSKSKLPFILICIFLLLFSCGLIVYYFFENGLKIEIKQKDKTSQQQAVITSDQVAINSKSEKENINNVKIEIAKEENKQPVELKGKIFSGKLKKIDKDLQIFNKRIVEDDNNNRLGYYEAGAFIKGDLKGYTRIVAACRQAVFILATKDFNNYILNYDYDHGIDNSLDNVYYYLDKNKIKSTKKIEMENNSLINLDKKFSLYFKSNLIKDFSYIEGDLFTDGTYLSYEKLSSPFDNLTIYLIPKEKFYSSNDEESKAETDYEKTTKFKEKYIIGRSEVIVVDSVGLASLYSMTTKENIDIYKKEKTQYEIDLEKSKDSESTTGMVVSSPDNPSFSFESSRINNKSNLNYFKKYGVALDIDCGGPIKHPIVTIKDYEVEQIGDLSDLPLYRLKDKNHELNLFQYQLKVGNYKNNDLSKDWIKLNDGISKPTFEEYVSKNPLLFIKNYWGQFVLLGERDIILPCFGGGM